MTDFVCKKLNFPIPEKTADGFCAKQFRKGMNICRDCDRGRDLAKMEADLIRSQLPPAKEKARYADSKMREAELKKSKKELGKEEDGMAEKKKCSDGCGKNAVKDGLAWACYVKKHGKPPYETKTVKKIGKKVKKQAGRQGSNGSKVARSTGHDHKCEGCEALQLRIDDLDRAEKIMVAAGLVTAEKFDQARKIARELGA